MRASLRSAAVAGCAVVALAFGPQALASYQPQFAVVQQSYRVAGKGIVAVAVAQRASDDATAKIELFAPPGYAAALTQPAATTIGSVVALMQPLALGSGAKGLTLTGSVTTDAPSRWATNPCAGGSHEAVWLLNLKLSKKPYMTVPVFVDHTTGPEAAVGPVKLQVCFAPPDIPEAAGGAKQGVKLLSAIFTLDGVFTNPSSRGTGFVWRALFTPYLAGKGLQNPTGAREAQSVVPIPYAVTLARVSGAPRGRVRLAGRLMAGGSAVVGRRVDLYNSKTDKLVAHATTRKGGRFVFTIRTPKATTLYYAERPVAHATCAQPVTATKCVSATMAAADSPDVRVAVKRR